MTNFLNLAGLGAIGGIIASSWNTIKSQLDKLRQLIFVSTVIHTRVFNSHCYLFIKDNYKISFLDKKEYVRDYEGGFCKYYILDNSLVRGKGLNFFWVTVKDRTLSINYIRGFFNIKKFLEKFEDHFKLDINTYNKLLSRSCNVNYIEHKVKKDSDNAEVTQSSGRDSTPNSSVSITQLHDSVNSEKRDYITGKPSLDEVFKHNYILPSYLEYTTKEFLNWSNPDIRNLFKNILNISSAKGYCLYGLPGTGKSSYIKYLAERAGGMSIDIIQLNTLSSKELVDYFKESKDNYVIRVIEDIDSVFNLRERVDQRLNSSDLTFDVLLNCLSGIDSPTTGFTFITTNYIDKIDSALLRAGRLDNIIEIRIPDKEDYEKCMIPDLIC